MTSVVWEAAARDELDAIWSAASASESPVLEQLVLDLLADLRADPLDVGESRGGAYRVAVRSPLTVWFEVRDAGQQVRIVRVHRPARRM